MKKFLIFVIFIVLIISATIIFDKGKFMKKENTNFNNPKEELIREPVAAGSFYPNSKEELENMIDKYLWEVECPTLEGDVWALIVPHAGYQFSGQVSACAYKALTGQDINTIIIVGPSHYEYFDGASIFPRGYYKTPLGKIEVDKDLAKKIIDSNEKINFRENVHSREHSIEVQLPFLQRTLKNFKIVPIIIGNTPESVDILIKSLKGLIDKNTLIIASSDLSHYPSYENAKYSDNKVIEAILTGERENLRETVNQIEKENILNLQTCACGQQAIEVVMRLAKILKTQGIKSPEEEKVDIKLLKYANSGDVSVGDKKRVVGYATIAFINSINSSQLELKLSKEEQKELLKIAKESVGANVRNQEIPEFSNKYSVLEKHFGAFVTLKKANRLRGCIGYFEPEIPLYQVVRDMAISASSKDARFNPITEDELKDLEYEISVLSPLKRIKNWEDIKINKHGVYIKQGFHSGVFLPQVATENNWDLDTFMNTLCQQKAGLPADCWKNAETEIYIFTAQVFNEKDIK